MEEHELRQITGHNLLERFGDNYVARLMTFSRIEVDEIMSVCEELWGQWVLGGSVTT